MRSDVEREELARLIFRFTGFGPFPDEQEVGAAEAILKAGYSKREGVTLPRETLRLLIEWAVRGGADQGLYASRKALNVARTELESL